MHPETAAYVRAACQVPPMSPEQETAAFERVRAGDESARKEIVEANVRLVVSIAQRLASRGVLLDDMISTGVVALYETVDRHAKSRHKTRKFSTYASTRILSHLSDLVRRSGSLGITQKVWSLDDPVSAHMRKVLSLDQPVAGPDGAEESAPEETLGDVVPAAEGMSPTARASLREQVERLPQKWAAVVSMLYGIGGVGPLTQEEVALRLGIGQPRVAQILKAALKRLRSEME